MSQGGPVKTWEQIEAILVAKLESLGYVVPENEAAVAELSGGQLSHGRLALVSCSGWEYTDHEFNRHTRVRWALAVHLARDLPTGNLRAARNAMKAEALTVSGALNQPAWWQGENQMQKFGCIKVELLEGNFVAQDADPTVLVSVIHCFADTLLQLTDFSGG